MPRFKTSLYARASLFLLLGSAGLVGAVMVLSSTMVQDSIDRRLDERVEFARTVGALLEQRLRADMDRLADAAAAILEAGGDHHALGAALASEYRRSAFGQGVFVLGPDGAPVTSLPGDFSQVAQALDVGALLARSRAVDDLVASRLVRLPVGDRPVLVLLQPLKSASGRLGGYHVGGLLAPASDNVLEALTGIRGPGRADLDVVDLGGRVIASTDRRTILQAADHDSVLAEAISTGRELTGQCHSCHLEGAEAPVVLRTEVLAFTRLPTLELGVAVRQPEREAFASADSLRRQLFLVGGAFVALFLFFGGLSVRSVVEPLRRLTQAVSGAEEAKEPVPFPRFGRDEVGSLARAVEVWRERTLHSLASEKRHREALHEESEAMRLHLEALQEVAAHAMLGAEAGEIVELGLDRALAVLNMSRGVLRVQADGRGFVARRGFDQTEADLLLQACADHFEKCEHHDSPLGPAACSHGPMTPDALPAGLSSPLGAVLGAFHASPRGLRISCVLTVEEEREQVQGRWLQSLVHHIGISVTSRVLRDKDHERRQQQAQYLHRVLKAQENERRRVARELHDTIAQDLAALRLEIERLGSRTEDPSLRSDLFLLEAQAASTLEAVRLTLLDLRLSVLENMGFLPTLQWHLERVQRSLGVRGTLSIDGEERPLDYERAVTLFRILQECVQNSAQHGAAEHVFVTVDYGEDFVEMTVEDDGRGFDTGSLLPLAGEEPGSGLGILGMEERAHLLGGELFVVSRPGEGTTVTVRVPLGSDHAKGAA